MPIGTRARFALYYEQGFRRGLLSFKYNGALHMGPALTKLALDTFRQYYQAEEFDLIVPVPMTKRRLIHRGFNQVAVMARKLSAQTGIPADCTSLQKVVETPRQAELPREDRLRNLQGAFTVTRLDRIAGKRVLLMDDVSTTGATINEVSRTIRQARAASVAVLALGIVAGRSRSYYE
jgi:ComF family protein